MAVILTLSAATLVLFFIAITSYVNLNIGMAVFSDRFLQVSRAFLPNTTL